MLHSRRVTKADVSEVKCFQMEYFVRTYEKDSDVLGSAAYYASCLLTICWEFVHDGVEFHF